MDSFIKNIGDAMGHKDQPAPPPPAAPPKEESLFDKIGGTFGGKKTPPPPPPEDNDLFSKLTSSLTGKKEEPAKPQGLMDHFNNALGGGAKGETQEGKLDKAIDMFQEHVLKQGPQHNESAVEQMKDDQIANTIRKTLGMPAEKERKEHH